MQQTLRVQDQQAQQETLAQQGRWVVVEEGALEAAAEVQACLLGEQGEQEEQEEQGVMA